MPEGLNLEEEPSYEDLNSLLDEISEREVPEKDVAFVPGSKTGEIDEEKRQENRLAEELPTRGFVLRDLEELDDEYLEDIGVDKAVINAYQVEDSNLDSLLAIRRFEEGELEQLGLDTEIFSLNRKIEDDWRNIIIAKTEDSYVVASDTYQAEIIEGAENAQEAFREYFQG